MNFSEGQTIVHPHHGPATVRAITRRRVKSTDADYLVLDIRDTNLTVSVPVASADVVGLRDVLSVDEVERLLGVLRAPTVDEETQWSRRIKANAEKLKTGDIYMAASIVRDLSRRLATKGLSLAEKDMLKEAKRPLVTEVSLALELSEQDADAVLESAGREAMPAVA
ncbi:CarD family transcriptional regulator [Diaminobutyricimonas sp. LJ205]|uniref:CarD family transcriptional regulator n=1 Tax=Diaminobutyricimonas sp. LJ205 TaxID=2683590 RepID=UPI0012F521CD|nr:CarD family transcriptional regulator [Diaminobutyricimonas sp. LJ205]